MKSLTIYTVLFLTLLSSCTSSDNELMQDQWSAVLVDNSADYDLGKTNTSEEETTISMPMQQHLFSISRQHDEVNQTNLSDQNVRDLESWWDSLPQPLQSEIKANKIDIEVVSEITTADEQTIDPRLNDSQIEKTGETLEQIIGANTDMKYTVSTKLLDSANISLVNEQHTTNIRLVKQVPVKLQTFATEVYLREGSIVNENIQTLQYWWDNLPTDIQEKIKTRELEVNLTCHVINPEVEAKSITDLQALANQNAVVSNDILNRLIGVYKVGDKEYSMAKTLVQIKIETATEKTTKLPAQQYLSIKIHNNKDYLSAL